MTSWRLGIAAALAAWTFAASAVAAAQPVDPVRVANPAETRDPSDVPGPRATFDPIAADAALPAPAVQSAAQAIAQDAAQYALANHVDDQEAVRRLAAQEASVPATDRLQRVYRDRLAGLSIDHEPVYRIVVLLTGDAPVRDRWIVAGGMAVPVVFRTGASATRDQVVSAIRRHAAAIETMVPSSAGMGLDPRTGELVVMADGFGEQERARREGELAALSGVPVRIRDVERPSDFALGGGARVFGRAGGLRQACTAGFVVSDRTRTGIVTAAHCPDSLIYQDREAGEVALRFVGQWGVSHQDVQVNVSEQRLAPVFYLDNDERTARSPASTRARTSTRAGDALCHRGVYSGYSCSQVELTDYAPAGALCAGPCAPVWTTVAGPSCKHGDSGGPVFSGGVAFGIVKGGSYRGGRCSFYFYMSTDYLPEGWTLMLAPGSGPAALPAAGPTQNPVRIGEPGRAAASAASKATISRGEAASR